jgi:hypothetical protein
MFNVNGVDEELLVKALELCILQDSGYDYGAKESVTSWRFSKTHGLLLSTYRENDPNLWNKFIVPLSIEEAAGFAFQWLDSPDARSVPVGEWENRHDDYDVDSDVAWRVYCDDWGHVDGDWRAFCAVKRVYAWYGK